VKAQQATEVLLDQKIQTAQQEQPTKQYNIKTQERKFFLGENKRFQHSMPYLQVLSNHKNHVEGSLPFFSMYANRVLEITTTKKEGEGGTLLRAFQRTSASQQS